MSKLSLIKQTSTDSPTTDAKPVLEYPFESVREARRGISFRTAICAGTSALVHKRCAAKFEQAPVLAVKEADIAGLNEVESRNLMELVDLLFGLPDEVERGKLAELANRLHRLWGQERFEALVHFCSETVAAYRLRAVAG